MAKGSARVSDEKGGSTSLSNLTHNVVHNGSINGHVNGRSVRVHADPASDNEDDVPLSQTARKMSEAVSPPSRAAKRKKSIREEPPSSDDDIPLASSSPVKIAAIPTPNSSQTPKAVSALKGKEKPKKKKRGKVASSDEEGGDDEYDAAARKKKSKRKRKSDDKVKPPPSKKPKKEESDDDIPLAQSSSPVRAKRKAAADDSTEDVKPKKRTNKSTKAEKDQGSSKLKEEVNGSPAKKGRAKKEEEEPEEIFKWWEMDVEGDGSIKWQTLEHNGVLFPPPYEPLPMNVKMKYNGKPVNLPPEAEEVAGFYAAMLETDHARDQTFVKNFFDDWKSVLQNYPPRDGTQITTFELCDFRPMFEHFEAQKAAKKALSSAERKELRKAKEEFEAKYAVCLLDSRKEKVGNFRIEPPGLFRGRGDHPRKGALKLRVRPEDITINIAKGAKLPEPNVPGKWKKVIHDQTVTWLANWTENVNGNHKYVFLAAGSSLKGQSDMIKFEKARELKNHVQAIRQEYTADLKNKVMAERQRATAMYFIDRLALRAGNEKGEEEADTVGCCSLRCEHVTLEAPNFIIFDFLGKDSIRYYNRVEVESQVFKNVRIFKENKSEEDNLFDRVTTTILNKYLTSKMKGLTAKVFRTYNASITFQDQLDNNTPDVTSVQEKLNAYNQANRMVAILCNHQRSVPKTHEQSMEKMKHRLRGLKYERMKLRHALLSIDSKNKKSKKYSADESDIDDEWIEAYEEEMKTKDIEKVEKKFAKENEKLEQEGQKPQKDSVLKERIAAIEEEYKRLAKERGTGKASLKKDRPAEKLEENIEKLDERIKTFKLQIQDRDAGKEVALGTSKINYLDPRITAAWCGVHGVPIEKIFSKALLTKFPWAMEVENDWKF